MIRKLSDGFHINANTAPSAGQTNQTSVGYIPTFIQVEEITSNNREAEFCGEGLEVLKKLGLKVSPYLSCQLQILPD